MKRLLRMKSKNNCKNNFDLFLVLAGLGISIYSVYINKLNVYYNKQNVESSNRIAEQLSRLNNSDFMYKLNIELDKCKEEKE